MVLAALIDRLRAARIDCRLLRGGVDVVVGRVRDRDDTVAAGDVFVAIKGARVDGHTRVGALGHAAVIVVESAVEAPPGPAVLWVDDTRRALPHLAAARLGDPGAALPVVGVTGTNGKTSITWLLAAMARAAGRTVGVIGTTGHFVGDEALPAAHTTPGAVETQELLARMRDAGCGLVAMEVSSIGLAAHRADAIPFAAGIFTNLTRDHLDWHGTMEAYTAAKARLFHELLVGPAVLNARDPASARMVPPGGPVWWYNDGDLFATEVVLTASGTRARFHTPKGSFHGQMALLGAHNVENALGALGGALAVGLPLEACAAGLAALPAVPGRLEAVPNHRGFTVLVDYAHTDDALRRVLGTLRTLAPARILTVFGCGGDRDRGKRPLMGAAAAEGSDLVVLTSDNPRSEDPAAILADVLPGVGTRAHHVEPDRRAAIAWALARAAPGDIVLIAGKGHEATQTIGAHVLPFDDRAVAAELLA